MTAHLLACIFGICRRHSRHKSDAVTPFNYGAVGEPVLSALDALNERTAGWDGYDAPAPDARAVAAAMEWVKQFCGVVSAAGMAWEAPHVMSDEAGNVALEWWDGVHSLTVYVTPASVEYLKAWGANIHSEMADGVIACPTDALALWAWLHADGLPLVSRREAEAAEARRRAAVESRGNGE